MSKDVEDSNENDVTNSVMVPEFETRKTCGGYSMTIHDHYSDNVIMFAKLLSGRASDRFRESDFFHFFLM